MREPLQAWYDKWLEEHKNTDLIYVSRSEHGPYLKQVHFIRDNIARLLWADVYYYDMPREPAPRTDCVETAWVIGEHRSKSVRLPVYSIERPDKGIRLVLRDNYHDWKLSVISETSIQSDLFPYLFKTEPPPDPDYTGYDLSACYFEGFPEELVFGYYAQNPSKWSASLGSDEGLWTVTLVIAKALGIVEPRRSLTRAEHRAKLDAESASYKRYQERNVKK